MDRGDGGPANMAFVRPGVKQTGNFTGLQNTIFGVNTTFLVLAIAAVGLRVWSRSIKRMRLTINDAFAVAALVVLIPFFAIMAYGMTTGMGRHLKDLRYPRSQVPHLLKLMLPLQVLWSTINTLVKISMIDLYLRVFPAKRLRQAAYVLLGCVCAYWIAALLVVLVGCRPFALNWDKTIIHGSCLKPRDNTLGLGITNLILDVAIIIIPLPYLYTLQLKLAKRVSLITIFAIGFIITAISAVRVNIILNGWRDDFSVGSAQIALWSFLETSLSVINCCLPTIQPAVIAVFRSTSYIFSHVSLSTNRPSEKEDTFPTHKFITLPLDSAAYYSRSDSPPPAGMPPRDSDRPHSSHKSPATAQDIPLEQTSTPQKEQLSHAGFSEGRSHLSIDGDSVHSTKSEKSLPPLPPEKNDNQVKREWRVDYAPKKDGW